MPRPTPLPKPTKDSPGQTKIDWGRGEKLNLLRNLELPPPPAGSKTSKGAMLAVLQAVDDRCGKGATWIIPWDDLATATGLGRNTVRRAAKALEALDLLVGHPRKDWGWHPYSFQIIWSNLQDYRKRGTERPSAHGDMASAHGGTPSAHGGHTKKPPIDLPIRNAPSITSTDGAILLSQDDDGAQRFVAERYARSIGSLIGTQSDDNVSLAIKVGVLVATLYIGEDEFHQAEEAVQIAKRKGTVRTNPAAMFHRCLDNKLGGRLNEFLKRVPNHKKREAAHRS